MGREATKVFPARQPHDFGQAAKIYPGSLDIDMKYQNFDEEAATLADPTRLPTENYCLLGQGKTALQVTSD